MCKGLDRDHGHDLMRCLFGCFGLIFSQRSSDVFDMEVFQSSSLNSLVAHSRQNQCCVLDWGSYANFHCGEVLGLHLALRLFFSAQAYGNVGSQTY
jgi:hypothetical protein